MRDKKLLDEIEALRQRVFSFNLKFTEAGDWALWFTLNSRAYTFRGDTLREVLAKALAREPVALQPIWLKIRAGKKLTEAEETAWSNRWCDDYPVRA